MSESMMNGQRTGLILSTIAMVISFTVWTVVSPIASLLQERYQLSEVEVSVLVATPVLLGSLMRIPMGMLTDYYGGRLIYSLTMIFLIFPLIAAGFAQSFILLLICIFFIGMAGSTFSIAVSYVSRLYPPEKQGFVLGIVGLGNFGSAVSSFSIPMIVTKVGLSWTFWGLAFAIGLMTVFFWTGTKKVSQVKEEQTVSKSIGFVIRLKFTRTLSLFYFITFGGFIAFSIYLPVLLRDLFSLSLVNAGFKAAAFVLIATFIRPLGGLLADMLGARSILPFLFVGICISSSIIAISSTNFSLFTIGCLTLAILFGIGNGVIFKLVPEIAPSNTGLVTGIVGAVGGVGGFILPIVLGLGKSISGNYFFGFMLLAILSLFSFFLALKNWQPAKITFNDFVGKFRFLSKKSQN